MKRFELRSTLPGLDEVGTEVLRKGGSALRAVLTSFFVAAGEHPGILFGPTSLLVAGVGSGARVYDGRCRQPGLGTKRPRGFVPGDVVPAAARVAIPGSLAALSLGCAYDQGTSLLSCVRPGVAAARRAGSDARANLLELVVAHGAATLGTAVMARAWVGQFGAAEGGTCGPADLVPAASIDFPASASGETSGLPWGDEDIASLDAQGAGHALIAVDGQGQFVALSFRDLPSGLLLEQYDVTVPLLAEPVRRGLERAEPGSVVPTPAGLEVTRDESAALIRVRAFPRGPRGASVLELGRDPRTKNVG